MGAAIIIIWVILGCFVYIRESKLLSNTVKYPLQVGDGEKLALGLALIGPLTVIFYILRWVIKNIIR